MAVLGGRMNGSYPTVLDSSWLLWMGLSSPCFYESPFFLCMDCGVEWIGAYGVTLGRSDFNVEERRSYLDLTCVIR